MLQLHSISKTFHDNLILDNVSFAVNNHEVVALIGRNGTGKTTLLKIITGDLIPDSGQVINHALKIAYLPQHVIADQQSIREYIEQLVKRPVYKYEIDIALGKTNLAKFQHDQKVATLSGGQKTRLGIASLLINEPDLLILDEPTNNLDSDGLVWLQKFIQTFKGSILLTSHDRFFLDQVAHRIIELKDSHAKEYGGNYSDFKDQKEADELAYLKRYEENKEEIKRLENRIHERKAHALKFSKTKPAKDNDKMQSDYLGEKAGRKSDNQAKALESRLNQIEILASPRKDKRYPLNLEGIAPATHKLILRAATISKSYGNNKVISALSFEVTGSEHVQITGPNGAGKSTLLTILAGRLMADSGDIKYGTDIQMGYFTQEVSQLDLSNCGFTELKKTGATDEQCYKQAKNLSITPQLLQSPLQELSRGQIAKIEFTKLLLQENDILILDEPTNHLDLPTREEIESALLEYKGALIIASHDRYFVETIGIDKEIGLN